MQCVLSLSAIIGYYCIRMSSTTCCVAYHWCVKIMRVCQERGIVVWTVGLLGLYRGLIYIGHIYSWVILCGCERDVGAAGMFCACESVELKQKWLSGFIHGAVVKEEACTHHVPWSGSRPIGSHYISGLYNCLAFMMWIYVGLQRQCRCSVNEL
jgi:hypothetical protein